MTFGPSFLDTIEVGKKRKGGIARRSRQMLGVPEWVGIHWQWRLVPVVLGMGLVFLLLVGRLWQLQIVQGEQGRQASRSNSLAIELLPAARGIIYDRHDTVLARNEPAFRVAVTYSRLPAEGPEREGIVELLAYRLAMSVSDINQRLEQAKATPFVSVTIKGHIDRDTEISLLSVIEDLPGISIEQDLRRSYPLKEALSHVLGYTGSISEAELKDPLLSDYYPGQDIGKSGIEKTYERDLHGQLGKKFSQVDAFGLPQQASNEQAAVAGKDLRLSIDAELQAYVYQTMLEAAKKYGSKGASAVIQDPTTGEVLALVSLPSYDNNLFARGLDAKTSAELFGRSDNPLFNRVIAGTYPPGSTVKPLMGAAAVMEGIIQTTTLVYSPNIISVAGTEYADWTYWIGRSGPGNINVITAIAQSTDTFFYKVSGGFEGMRGMGVEAMYRYYSEAGFGSLTGIDLPGEQRGVVPNPAWKRSQFPDEPTWYLGNTYHMSIGQGYLLTTPLQVNAMTSAIAHNGVLLKPRLATAVLDGQRGVERVLGVEVINEQVLERAGLEVAQKGFREGVSNGIVFPLRDNPWQVAAKTGTAEFGVRGQKDSYGTHAWVTGYAPYDKPRVSFTIMLENGATSTNAAEIADGILRWMFGR